MHAFFPPYRPFTRRFLPCLYLIAACLFFPALVGAEPEGAAPDTAPATPPAVQEALQSVMEQATAPAPAPAPSVQAAAALPGVPGENAGGATLTAPPLHMAWLLDPKGSLSLTDVLTPEKETAFTPYKPDSLPHHAGTLWLRLTPEGKIPATPLTLDLNTRIAGQLPGIPQVWLARPEAPTGTPVRPSSEGLYPLPNPLPEQTAIYIRVNGLPAPGFFPMLRAVSGLTVVDELGAQPQLMLLAVLLFICLLRGMTERREWRMWAALYIAAVWVQAFWGLPTTPAGEVSRWDMPGLLAPGVALLILPHVGRHMMRTRLHAPLIDMQFILLALLGILISVAPLVPGYAWTLQFLPLWPLFMLLLLPGTLAAWARHLPGAKRFLLICLLPPLSMLALFPLSRLLPQGLIDLLPSFLDGFMTPGVVSLIPLTGLTLSALIAALSPSPKLLPAPNRSTRETPKTGKAGVAALELGGFPETTPLDRLPVPGPEGALELASFAAPEAAGLDAPAVSPRRAPHPEALQAPLTAGMVEETLRAPLDALLRAISAVDQAPLSGEARRRTATLGVTARNLATAIGNMGRTASRPNPAATERFDLNQLLLETHDAVSSLAESKNLGLSWFTAPHLPRCYEGNRSQLAAVLALLVESAVLATEHGTVQVRAQRVPESTDPGHLLFTVSDTGTGMPPLGRSTLALIRAWELAGPEGEHVSLESGPKGTSVSFSLHLTACAEDRPLPATPEAEDGAEAPRPSGNLRIIVVSSVPANRQMLSFYLDELPHEIIEARSPEEAQKRYRRAPAALLIFDDDMPVDAVGSTVAGLRVFEGEHSLPLASILALINNDEQIEALRRAGCTHFLRKPVTRKEVRILALRLAPVTRRSRDYAPEAKPEPETAPAPEAKPILPDLPDLPAPEAHKDTPERNASKPGLLASLFQRLRSSGTTASPAAPQEEEPLTLTEKTSEKPLKLSSVGEPMPISKADALSSPQPRPRSNPLEERLKRAPSRSSAPENATEWVGEPMPIVKKDNVENNGTAPAPETVSPARPVSPSPAVPSAQDASAAPASTLSLGNEADEWVGEPMPIVRPLSLDPQTDDAPTPAVPETRPAESPLELNLPTALTPLASPTADASKDAEASEGDVLELGQPLSEPAATPKDAPLSLTGWEDIAFRKDAPARAGQAAEAPSSPASDVITLSQTITPSAEGAAHGTAQPLPDLFGDLPAPKDTGGDSLLEEAARLKPCAQGSRPTPSTGTLDIEDIVELAHPLPDGPKEEAQEEATLPPSPQEEQALPALSDDDAEKETDRLQPTPEVASAPTDSESAPFTPEKEDRGTETVPEEATDEDIRKLLTELDAALGRAIRAEQVGDAHAVCEAAGRIGQLAEHYDLRGLSDPARCLEEAACAGKTAEIAQLIPDLVAAINRNRASFEED